MLNRNRGVVCVVVVLLWACVGSEGMWGQGIAWERTYSEEHPLPLSGGFYSGHHIEPMGDGGYVVTGITGGGFTVAVARFDSEGRRLWERSITDTSRNILGKWGNSDPLTLRPRFSYVREDGRVILFANEAGTPGFSNDYGFVYLLVLDESTGEPVDTIAGWPDTTASIDNASVVCRMGDGRFMSASAYAYSLNLDTLGKVLLQPLTEVGGYDTASWYNWYSVGQRSEGEEVYHYPSRMIQTPDGGFVVYGVRLVVGGPSTLFLLRIDSAGGKVWGGQSRPVTDGQLSGAFFDTTQDGGFIAVGSVSYYDPSAQRKRWRVMRLVKFSSEGVEEWSRDYEGGADYTTAKSVRQTLDGGYVMLGTVGGFNETYSLYLASKEDAFLLKTDSQGREEWRKRWGDSARQDLWYMLLQDDGSVIVTGNATKDTVWNGLYLAKINIGTAGVESEEEGNVRFTVQPNPVHDRLRVVLGSALIGAGEQVRLFDFLGREVLRREFSGGSSGSVELDISEMPEGAYRAVIEGKEGQVIGTESVIIVR